jgi:hypothetical protein
VIREDNLTYEKKLKIGACGDVCTYCHRYIATKSRSKKKLIKVAELWHSLGLRDRVVTPEEIACTGCRPENSCRYKIVKCACGHNVNNCGECGQYACVSIKKAFARTAILAKKMKKTLSRKEYGQFEISALCKKQVLDGIHKAGIKGTVVG